MKTNSYYPFKQVHSNRYTFVSHGKRPIKKAVDFTYTGWGKIINMGFGDLLPDGTVDDKVNSNNGDLVMVLATTIEILKLFTAQFPNAEIFFTGSTQARTRLYARIVKNYYSEFSKEFIISVLIKDGDAYDEMPYEPGAHIAFYGFIIRRIS